MMPIPKQRTFSVPEVATLCGVSRSTINNWVQSRRLHASRTGRNYAIAVSDLLLFLRTTGRPVPAAVLGNQGQQPVFRSYEPCWEYWRQAPHGRRCADCIVFRSRLETCFIAGKERQAQCRHTCGACAFWQEIYAPRAYFVHQLGKPAAMSKGLYLWAVNRRFADLCHAGSTEFLGRGIETVMHPESLPAVISAVRKNELGSSLPAPITVRLGPSKGPSSRVSLSFFPLEDPEGCLLMLATPLLSGETSAFPDERSAIEVSCS